MFASLRHRNYRLFFFGIVVSLVGTWMQMVAEGWLVFELTRDEFSLGLIRFLHALPVTLLTVPAGVLADHWPKRRILLVTQSVSMFLAAVLFVLVWQGWVQVWHVGILAFTLGCFHAFDIPARQSFIVEMVGRRDLMNAIALNSSAFNGARLIGPALAGLVIANLGLDYCFLLNALSFLAVLGAYLAMRLPREENPGAFSKGSSIKSATSEAVAFVWKRPALRALMAQVACTSLLGLSYVTLMPVVASQRFGLSGSGYGYLMAVNGAGALVGALTLARWGGSCSRRFWVLLGANGFGVGMTGFTWVDDPWVAGWLLFLAGWFMILFFSSCNTWVQLLSPDGLRGRIMGLYSFCFIGISPFGALFAGWFAGHYGASSMIRMGSFFCLLVLLIQTRVLLKPADEA